MATSHYHLFTLIFFSLTIYETSRPLPSLTHLYPLLPTPFQTNNKRQNPYPSQ
jgi:hypothetical protein